jgi:hypothetical protein
MRSLVVPFLLVLTACASTPQSTRAPGESIEDGGASLPSPLAPRPNAPLPAPSERIYVVMPATTDECSHECTGAGSPDLVPAIRERASEARLCYDRALRENPRLAGKVQLRIRIAPAGAVCGVKIEKDTLGSPWMARCLEELFKIPFRAAPADGCVETVVPLAFESREAADGGAPPRK